MREIVLQISKTHGDFQVRNRQSSDFAILKNDAVVIVDGVEAVNSAGVEARLRDR